MFLTFPCAVECIIQSDTWKLNFCIESGTAFVQKSKKLLEGLAFFLSYNLSDDLYLVFRETVLGTRGFSETQAAFFKWILEQGRSTLSY